MQKLITHTSSFIDAIIKVFPETPFQVKVEMLTFKKYLENFNATDADNIQQYIDRLQREGRQTKTKTEPPAFFQTDENINHLNWTPKLEFNKNLNCHEGQNKYSSNLRTEKSTDTLTRVDGQVHTERYLCQP